MAFNGPLQRQSVVAGMRLSDETANVHFHHASGRAQDVPVRVLPLIPIALWGLSGSGKTQVALEFAYRRSDVYME
ncbi:hypothetical protein CGRA01v4_07916 [Colletotrichum graminicola]|uniref:Uncharacterized protein n=1 Tax=Colletotrichum graminicola (strain M1.001 / M2 / FGSC 10212) TaxID=645133 RepID=E3Q7R0_COLGM|nr:uncharacterized protein GLRG_02093 [Colletotrichum graminicola M1.001]EFQ26922.1 hypothetical protein GLRG_02093 [Colletotrichum graminicola M1.001]WDK16633.1 hypothetical protein CGRA01v4_07916 [Colletotrichum graminicola]